MDNEQKDILLKIAHDSLIAAIKEKSYTAPKSDIPALNEHCGCFVTLKNNEHLRGCIGQFTSEIPLIELIAQMAKASATSDPRFRAEPITMDELDKMDIEISVLSPLKLTNDPLSLRLGIDGIFIKKGNLSGCFLPQVATETNWSKQQFLSYCCSHKAGLPEAAWKQPDTEVYLFSAEVFGEDFNKI